MIKVEFKVTIDGYDMKVSKEFESVDDILEFEQEMYKKLIEIKQIIKGSPPGRENPLDGSN